MFASYTIAVLLWFRVDGAHDLLYTLADSLS